MKNLKKVGLILALIALVGGQKVLLAADEDVSPLSGLDDITDVQPADTSSEPSSNDITPEITAPWYKFTWAAENANKWIAEPAANGFSWTKEKTWDKHPNICAAAAGAIVTAAILKAYYHFKTQAALDSAQSKDLQALEAQLDNPNLTDDERSQLEKKRDVIIAQIVTEFYNEKSATDAASAIVKAMNPMA
ncbi:hypothetical protein KAW80_00815 [Candidatus Babeliales bacterium]|nr:hypothetical protein [Candidatus Babeliales bacterium]